MAENAWELEDAGTELLKALPLRERSDILLHHQVRWRQRREVVSDLAFVTNSPPLWTSPIGEPGKEDGAEECAALLAAADLSERERTVLFLHDGYGLPDVEIAPVLGLSRPTVTLVRLAAQRKARAAAAELAR